VYTDSEDISMAILSKYSESVKVEKMRNAEWTEALLAQVHSISQELAEAKPSRDAPPPGRANL
jgi:hypothetical protein